MKQVIQNLRSGVLELLDLPCPGVSRGHLLIQSRASLISAGTERSLVEFGQASLVAKARQNPDRVRQVLDKIKSDGLLPTLEAVFSKLDDPLPLGYSNAGLVIEVGPGVDHFSVGDRVASNGQHAEMVHSPVNLCAKIPPEVTDDQAAFTVLGSIALQGIRLILPEIGETIAVFGLGLVGQMAVQILVAGGARVLGIDLDARRLGLAERFGATVVPANGDPVAAALAATGGRGVDGVLITASAKDDSIVSQSARMSRKRGRLVLVGVVNMQLNRAEFYEKELSFQVSCSYGPGRYDAAYEERGIDYPYAFVRWTEQRNFEAVLDLMAAKRIDVSPLITARIPHAEASRAYDLLAHDRSQLGIVLEYPQGAAPLSRSITTRSGTATRSPAGKARVGVIGAGNFTQRVVLPHLKKTPATLVAIASAGGVSGAHAARKFGFQQATTDYRTVLDDPEIDAVFITTRHHQHAKMVGEALASGKHVFVEKPLAIDRAGLEAVRQGYLDRGDRQLLVGFNRRFAPQALKIRELLAGRSKPACLTMLVNAGQIPAEHWTQDPQVGGGRIIGEGCHWFDLLSYLVDSPIVSVQAATIGDVPAAQTREDHMTIVVSFSDGSMGTIQYWANGHRTFPKERLEVFADGRVLELDNFRRLTGYGWPGFSKSSLWRQDKGHAAEFAAFVQRISVGGPPLIPPEELWNVTLATFAAVESAKSGLPVRISELDRANAPRNGDSVEPVAVPLATRP